MGDGDEPVRLALVIMDDRGSNAVSVSKKSTRFFVAITASATNKTRARTLRFPDAVIAHYNIRPDFLKQLPNQHSTW